MDKEPLRVPEHPCPRCKHPLDSATPVNDVLHPAPVPGDASVCINCAAPLVFNDDMSVRAMSNKDLANYDMSAKREIYMAMMAVLAMKKLAPDLKH